MKNLTSLSLLNPDRHRDVRILPGPDIGWSRRLDHAPIGLSETGVAACDYPLLFMKDSGTGRFRLVALFGLRPGTSFFVVNGQWQATYLPLAVMAAPFHLGGAEQALCIDEASDLVTTDSGTAIFADDGGETAELARIRDMLDYLRGDLEAADKFAAAMVDLGLMRPINVTLEFSEGESEQVEGLYSISPPQLAALGDAAILKLQRSGLLEKVHVIVSSLSQMSRIRQLSQFHFDRRLTGLLTEMDAQ